MTDEQAKLAHRVWGAMTTLDAQIETAKAKPNSASVVKLWENARDAFRDLNEDWQKAIGHPQELSSVVVAEILRQVADRLENETRKGD